MNSQLERAGRTAIKRKGPSAPLKKILQLGKMPLLSKKFSWVLDFGCGKGTDVSSLFQLGYSPSGWDPVHEPTMNGGYMYYGFYNYVLCTYVLNVIPKHKDRKAAVRKILRLLRPGGHAFISVRRDVKKSGWTKNGTYQTNRASPEYDIPEHKFTCESIYKNTKFEIYELRKER